MKLELYKSEQVEQSNKTPVQLKAAWIAALRSGKYEQGKGRLRTNEDKFCCLGVLCDIVDNTKWKWGGVCNRSHLYENDIALLPSSLNKILFTDIELIRQQTLTSMNDSGKSFKEIADYIEANLHVAE